MGIMVNLKESKSTFIPCDCKSEILVIEYDHKIGVADLTIYESRHSYTNKLSFWQKIRYCYNVFINNKPYADQIALSDKQLRDLKLFINSLNLQ